MKLLKPLCFDNLGRGILDRKTTLIPAFDQFVLAALVLVVFVGGMRLFYGAWPWELNKTWYRTRDAVHYLEALRAEKSRNLTQQRLDETKETACVVRLVRDAADTNSDGFDRTLVPGSAREVTFPTEEFRVLLRKSKRRSLNSPNQPVIELQKTERPVSRPLN